MIRAPKAFATARAHNRRIGEVQATSRITRHAVEWNSYVGGAMDTVCGRLVAIEIGMWEPGREDNCHICERVMGQEQEELSA